MNKGSLQNYSDEKAWQQAMAIMRSEGYEISSYEEFMYKRQLMPIVQEKKNGKVMRKEFR